MWPSRARSLMNGRTRRRLACVTVETIVGPAVSQAVRHGEASFRAASAMSVLLAAFSWQPLSSEVMMGRRIEQLMCRRIGATGHGSQRTNSARAFALSQI